MISGDRHLKRQLIITGVTSAVIVIAVIVFTLYINTVKTYTHDSLVTTLIVYESCTFAILGALIGFWFITNAITKRNQKEAEERNEQLEKAVKAATFANESKSMFLSHMSHEMRTPLNGIKGMLTLLAADEKFSGNEYLEKSIISTNHLLDLVNDVLDVSRITNGKLKLEEQVVSISGLKNYVESLGESAIEEKNINFVQRYEKIACDSVLTDECRIRQIISNILSNAFKYTDNGGNVSLNMYQNKLNSEKVELHIDIKDDGMGMSSEFLKYAFTPFVQVDRCNENSTGLGLALTGKLVEAMGGDIHIESEPGKGTAVMIALPLRIASKAEQSKSAQAISTTSFKGKYALIVEDNKVNMIITSRIFEHLGFNITCAENGEKAVESYESHPDGFFDVIIMDENMPVMNGLDATKKIRSCGRGDSASIPIIALTANAYIEDAARSIKCGMNEHLCKPIDISQLIKVLSKYVEHSVA